MIPSGELRARGKRRALLLLFTLVALGAALLGALPVNADSPSPSVAPTPAATPTAAGSPAIASPCPLPAVTPRPSDAPTPVPGETPLPLPLCPAVLSGNPVDLLAWLFNPIFQTMFLLLAVFYSVTGDIGIAIIVLTLIIKTILIPLFRAQIVSQRRMQMVQPEVRAIGVKYKGNRTKINEEQMRLYKERGVNPASGCLPSFLQLFLLLPIYSVINQGLAAPDISSALQFLGQPVLHIVCQAPGTLQPCIDPTIHWLGNLDSHVPEVLFHIPNPIFTDPRFGLSGLALVAAFLQLIQSRMMTPRTSDPQTRSQQRIFMILPLFSLFYGWFLPAGLFIYWIVFTAYSIVQQYLIVGWGPLFPLFGWTPGFAVDHQPRFPVTSGPTKRPDAAADGRSTTDSRSPEDRAAGTIRPDRQRARTSRRGRRR
ncbi:MAG: YidC/Oxa1 family membrane protein insertase [Chloroflexota bacterium]